MLPLQQMCSRERPVIFQAERDRFDRLIRDRQALDLARATFGLPAIPAHCELPEVMVISLQRDQIPPPFSHGPLVPLAVSQSRDQLNSQKQEFMAPTSEDNDCFRFLKEDLV